MVFVGNPYNYCNITNFNVKNQMYSIQKDINQLKKIAILKLLQIEQIFK